MIWARRGKAVGAVERTGEGGHGRTLLLRRAHGTDLEGEWRRGLPAEGETVGFDDLADPESPESAPALDLRSLAGSRFDTALPAPDPVAPTVIVPAVDADGAVIAFRTAAVHLALRQQDGETGRPDALACSEQLLALGAGGHETALAAILLADPAVATATWTVACYQIGDLSPSTLRDFPAAAPAVLTLAGCETAAHVAAELIVTNGEGVRWTALVRSGSEVLYQPMGPTTASASSSTGLLAARHRWEDRLLMWAACPDDGLGCPRAFDDDTPAASSDAMAAPQTGVPAAGDAQAARARVDALRSEMVLLRNENSSIRFENASLRSENTALRAENASLRSDVVEQPRPTVATVLTPPAGRPVPDGLIVVVSSEDRG